MLDRTLLGFVASRGQHERSFCSLHDSLGVTWLGLAESDIEFTSVVEEVSAGEGSEDKRGRADQTLDFQSQPRRGCSPSIDRM